MAISYEQFAERLVSSGLLTKDEVREAADKLPADKRGKDAQALARELIVAGKLTKHQASLLYQGETKGLVLGNYVILDKLGEGGMGEVYRARHKVMEREVALKVLPASMINSPEATKRFQREVRAAAKLEHQNIVIAYDADQAAGRHFLVMQFVDGRDLSNIVKQNGPMTIEQAIDCCSQAARGLGYAHSKGVIHRDIKPSNLLLDKTGTVKILDMGLARLAGQADEGSALGGLTQSGQIMGTVDYMAPEQAEDTREADHRADIYSLGCTLYVLLTAKAPYSGNTVLQKMMAHQQKSIPKLSDARGDASPKLDAVLAKMLAKRPEERYQSMDEVLGALASCLAREEAHAAGALAAGSSDSHLTAFLDKLAHQDRPAAPTRASTALGKHEETINKQPAAHADDTGTGITRPPRAKTKVDAKEEAKRKPLSAAANTCRPKWLAGALVAGGILSLGLFAGILALLITQPWQAADTDQPSDVADNAPSVAMAAGEEWLDLVSLIDGERDSVAGKWVVESGVLRLAQVEKYQRVAVPVVPEGDYRLQVKFSGTMEGDQRTVLIPLGQNCGALHLDLADDHRSGLKFKTMPLTDPRTPSRTTAFHSVLGKTHVLDLRVVHGDFQVTITASVDDRRLFEWQGLPAQLDAAEWKMLDPRQLGFGGWTSPRLIHEAKLQMLNGQAILLRAPPAGVTLPSWAVAPQSDLQPAANAPKIVLRKKLTSHTQIVHALSFHPNSQQLASGAERGQLYLWDAARGQKLGEFTGHTQTFESLAFALDGERLVSSDRLTSLKVWNVAKRSLISSTDGRFESVAFSPDGKLIATGGQAGTRALRDPATLKVQTPLEGYSEIHELAFSHDGKLLATAAGGRFDLHQLPEAKRLSSSQWNQPLKFAFSGDDGTVAVAGINFVGVQLFNLTETALATPARATLAANESVRALAWLPGNRYLVCATKSSPELQLWDTQTSKLVARLAGHTKPINAIALSPDGRTLATAGQDFDVILWDVQQANDSAALASAQLTARLRKTLPDSAAGRVVVSPDGKLIAARARYRSDRKINVWDAETGVRKFAFDTSIETPSALAFLPHPELDAAPGKALLAAGEDRGLVMFEMSRGTRIPTTESPKSNISWIAGAHGGGYMSTAGGMGDAAVNLWTLKDKDAGAVTVGHHGANPGNWVSAVAFNADDTRLASCGNDGKVRIYELPGGKEIHTLNDGREVHCLAFSPDGRLLASGDRTPCVKLWNVETGALEKTLTEFDKDRIVDELAFSPDGRLLAAAEEFGGGPLRIFDMALRGKPLVMNEALAASVAFLPTGHTLATANEKTGVQLWDIDLPDVEITTATFTAPDVAQGIEPVIGTGPLAAKGTGVFERKTVAGKSVLVASSGNRIYFQVDDSLIHAVPADSPDRFVMRMTVFDENQTGVGIVYHAHEPNSKGFAQGREVWQELRASGQWIELVYELPKARLANGDVHAADFFVTTNRSQLAIHSVTLERMSAKRPTDFTSALGMQFVRVPAGKSWLGGGGGKVGTKEVEFNDDFYLGTYEVTQEEWEKVMGSNPSHFCRLRGKDAVKDISDADLKRFPVESVSWDACQQFIAKLNAALPDDGWVYRLPTAAEWEYACRGGPSSQKEDFGFDFYAGEPSNTLRPDQANANRTVNRTCKVGMYPPNRLGLHDMHGNVREWCNDVWGASTPELRAYFMGNFTGLPADCRAASFRGIIPTSQDGTYGLRLARVPIAGSWQALLNGKDLTGWTKTDEGSAEVVLEGGQPTLNLTATKEHGVLVGRQGEGNFHLRFEVKASPNIGVGGGMHLVKSSGRSLQLWLNELQNIRVHRSGCIFQPVMLREGQFVAVGEPPLNTTSERFNYTLDKATPWQRIEVIRLGDSYVFLVNGRVASAFTDVSMLVDDKKIPFDALLPFDFYAFGGPASFRNIEVRKINALPPEVLELATWQSLFNGKDLTGWTSLAWGRNAATAKLPAVVSEDGRPAIKMQGAGDSYDTVLTSTAEFENYHLRLQYKWTKSNNLHAKVRYHRFKEDGGRWCECYLTTRDSDRPDANGKLNCYGDRTIDQAALRGDKLQLVTPNQQAISASADPQRNVGEWNTLEIICLGGAALHVLNGKIVNVATASRKKDGTAEARGQIELVCSQGAIYFRDIELRPISALPPEIVELAAWRPLFNGKDLTGWEKSNSKDTGTAKVIAIDGAPAIHFSGADGLMTSQKFQGYHLRFSAKQSKFGLHLLRGVGDDAIRLICEPAGSVINPLWVWGSGYAYQQGELRDGGVVGIGTLITNTSRLSLSSAALKPADQWQQFEVLRLGDALVFRVNGEAAGAVKIVRNGEKARSDPLAATAISFYTPGGAADFRDIEIREINALPPEVLATAARPVTAVTLLAAPAAYDLQLRQENYRGEVIESNSELPGLRRVGTNSVCGSNVTTLVTAKLSIAHQ